MEPTRRDAPPTSACGDRVHPRDTPRPRGRTACSRGARSAAGGAPAPSPAVDEEAAAERQRASDEPPLLDDQHVVELAPQHRLQREQLLPARGLLGGSAGPEGHAAFLADSLSWRSTPDRARRRRYGSARTRPQAHQPADDRHDGRRARRRGTVRRTPPRAQLARTDSFSRPPCCSSPRPRRRHASTPSSRAQAARPRVETSSARRTVRAPGPRRGSCSGPGAPRRPVRGRRPPGRRASRCARPADARARTRGASAPGQEADPGRPSRAVQPAALPG